MVIGSTLINNSNILCKSLTVRCVGIGNIGEAGHLSHSLVAIVVDLLLDDRRLKVDVLKIEEREKTHTHRHSRREASGTRA